MILVFLPLVNELQLLLPLLDHDFVILFVLGCPLSLGLVELDRLVVLAPEYPLRLHLHPLLVLNHPQPPPLHLLSALYHLRIVHQ